MTAPASPLGVQAEALLNKQFARLRQPTKYIASFRSKSGRHLALTRQTMNDIYVWAERFTAMEGVSVKNRDFPGQPYSPDQPRSSNLTTASGQLGDGNRTFYLKFDTLGALERFALWYDSV